MDKSKFNPAFKTLQFHRIGPGTVQNLEDHLATSDHIVVSRVHYFARAGDEDIDISI